MNESRASLWNWRSQVPTESGNDLVGYTVHALDGEIGEVDESSNAVDDAHFVVDTGFWIFGKKRLVPAGVVSGIDAAGRCVDVNMTKDQIKSAPDWNADSADDQRRSLHERYYGPYGL
jgi:hypothetical protein